jgi:hypothetical protein
MGYGSSSLTCQSSSEAKGVSPLKHPQHFEKYFIFPRKLPQAWPIQKSGAHKTS